MFFINLTCKCYVTWTIVVLIVVLFVVVFFSPRMEAPYFIFKCISVGVNKVLLLLLLPIENYGRKTKCFCRNFIQLLL